MDEWNAFLEIAQCNDTFHQWTENIGCLQWTIGEGKRLEARTRWDQTPVAGVTIKSVPGKNIVNNNVFVGSEPGATSWCHRCLLQEVQRHWPGPKPSLVLRAQHCQDGKMLADWVTFSQRTFPLSGFPCWRGQRRGKVRFSEQQCDDSREQGRRWKMLPSRIRSSGEYWKYQILVGWEQWWAFW